ncbi:MAG: DUF4147 domain-containing protein, partial [Gammaproteobacteria bacterium]|nr:DUF4147 domain-containing protein [Gammaproteobacteria bacterium]
MNKQISSLSNRELLLRLYHLALKQVKGEVCVNRALTDKCLNIEKIVLLATGKAAPAMALGAWKSFGAKIIRSLVITKNSHCEDLHHQTGMSCMETGHPIPDERSLQAGQAVIQFLCDMPKDATLLVLTSGGTSSLVDALPDGIELADLVRLNQWLIASGLDIKNINQIRQSISLVKAGRLLSYIPVKKVMHLIISDVPDDDLSIIGSGMLVKQNTIIPTIDRALPEWIIAMQATASALLGPEKNHNMNVEHEIVANNAMACDAVVEAAMKLGHQAFIHQQGLTGNVDDCARDITLFLKQIAKPGVHIWGGETTVTLPPCSGRGGRNQHLALLIARELAGCKNITVLVAGTDGTDGVTGDAGAIVDGLTIAKGEFSGMDIDIFLQKANAGEYLEETGDLINTGVTG